MTDIKIKPFLKEWNKLVEKLNEIDQIPKVNGRGEFFSSIDVWDDGVDYVTFNTVDGVPDYFVFFVSWDEINNPIEFFVEKFANENPKKTRKVDKGSELEEFVIGKIKELVVLIPNVKVRYEHHKSSDSNFIEISPKEVYRENWMFANWEHKLFIEFIERFPYETICCITSDALVGIGRVDFETQGEEYGK